MNRVEAVDYATAQLLSCSNNARCDARYLVCHTCGMTQATLMTHPETDLSKQEKILFKSLLMRQARGEPLAYIIGKKEFWSRLFTVNEHVLIPRPETELLVEITLGVLAGKKASRALDLGTGTGCIAVAIASERRDCSVVATDVSTAALQVAGLNATRHNVNVTLICSNWYEKLSHAKFDAIVCNPPYVSRNDQNLAWQVATFEPQKAIISKNNGLHDLKQVIAGAHKHLHPHGYLIVEHGFQQAKAVRRLFKRHHFKRIRIHHDLAGLERAVSGQASDPV